ncbi:MAG: TlpA disulfide reductase family protein [Planctomycetaceae bacterium]
MQISFLKAQACLWFFGLIAIASGCEPTPLDDDPPAKAAETSPASTESPEIQVAEKSWDEFEQEIGDQHGRVVVANIWTNTCAACLAEFPAYAELSRRWPQDEVVFYDINCDYDGIKDKPLAFYRPRLLKFLEEHKSDSRHVALTDPLIDFLDKNDIHSTPTVFVYDRSGKLVKQFDNHEAYKEEEEFHADDVGALIERLLEKKS